MQIRKQEYEVIEDNVKTLILLDLNEILKEYYNNFDFIVGDWAYGKVRLKGFYNENNKFVKKYNNIKYVKDYLKNNCAYGCKYFILKKQTKYLVEKED